MANPPAPALSALPHRAAAALLVSGTALIALAFALRLGVALDLTRREAYFRQQICACPDCYYLYVACPGADSINRAQVGRDTGSASIGAGLLLLAGDRVRRALRRGRAAYPACPSCGYDRTGLPPLAVCPECGATSPSPPEPAPAHA